MRISTAFFIGIVLTATLGAATLWVASSIVDGAVTRDATRRSVEWTQYAVHRLDRIETLAAGEPPTSNEWAIIKDLAAFGGVFRFKVFAPTGQLQFDSENPGLSGEDLGQHNHDAFSVVASGKAFSVVANGTGKANRPDLYSETYLPVTINGKIVAILETYFDQTSTTAMVSKEYARFSAFIIGLVSLALAVPSVGLIFLFRRLRRQNAELDKERLRALAADQAKTAFIATVSHELRTPMNGIIGVTQLLEDDGLSQEQTELLDILVSCSEAQMTLIEELLTFGALEAGALQLSEEPVTLSPFVRRATSFATVTAFEKGVSFEVTTHDDDLRVMIDEMRLRQVLTNLVGNAVKFTDAGKIELSAVFTPAEGTDVGELRIDVTDTGLGIPPDQHERIFERFTQVDSSSRRSTGGSGLGLAISQAIVHEMGGEITLTSVPDHGSIFTVRLPVRLARSEVSTHQITTEKAA